MRMGIELGGQRQWLGSAASREKVAARWVFKKKLLRSLYWWSPCRWRSHLQRRERSATHWVQADEPQSLKNWTGNLSNVFSSGNGVRAQAYVTKPSLEELAIKLSNLVCACARRDDCSQINWPCLRVTIALSTALVLLEWFVISCDTGAQCFQFSAKRKTPFRHLNWLSPQKASGPLFKWETGRRAATAFHIYRDLYLSFCRLLGGNWKLGFFIITN